MFKFVLIMFGIKRKVEIEEANNFFYEKITKALEALEILDTDEAENFDISKKAIKKIQYEYLFYLIYVLHTTEKYTEDSYLEDLLEKISDFFDKKIKLEEYTERFSKIDDVMAEVMSNAQNSGGIGAGIISSIIYEFDEEELNEIKIVRNKELEDMIGIDLENSDYPIIVVSYLSFLTGTIFGESLISFSKEVEGYFKKYNIK